VADGSVTARTDFDELALVHFERLRGVALGLCRNMADAQDLLQDTFERALSRWEHFAARGRHEHDPARACYWWLHRIMTNQFVSLYRRERLRRTVPLQEDRNDDAEAVCVPSMISRTGGLQLLEMLPARWQSLLVGTALGLTYQELAAAMGIPIGSVMSGLHRARAALAKTML
jgi:RNA polymerase sigma-70 factor (ECF subfamily)